MIARHAGQSFCTLLLCALFAVTAFAADDDSQPAPRFRGKTLSGETFNNESVKGKVIPLEFWTTWCPYCRDEEALVEKIDKEFASQGLIVSPSISPNRRKRSRNIWINIRVLAALCPVKTRI